jgi:serine O-acetyltransferase
MEWVSVIKKILRANYREEFFRARDKILKYSTENSALGRIIIHYYSNKVYKINREYNASLAVNSYGVNRSTQFPHGFSGVFISSGAKIGNNVTIYQQVTIGSNTLKDSKSQGCPIIGDNVILGAGAKVIGGVKIGNGVRVGANCVVVKDIPDNATVVCERPRIIIHDEKRDNSRGSWQDYV